jgi:hypothetical protein
MGNLIFAGPAGKCESLIDRSLAPAPESDSDDVYGDLYMRTNLDDLRASDPPPALKSIVDSLSGMTVRANVWDSVALSIEGAPVDGKSATDLASMARGAVSLAENQIDDDQVELRALADLAKVSSAEGKLQMDLAVPVNDLFDRFHFPCPGLADAGVQ